MGTEIADMLATIPGLKQDFKQDWTETTKEDWKYDWDETEGDSLPE